MKVPPRIFRPHITNERGVTAFVASVTAIGVVVALAADVTNQMVFFVDWPTALRSWAITTGITLMVAAPISRMIGKAYLELYRAKQQAVTLSLTDPLTGLPNRRALMAVAATAVSNVLALVIFDIDRFKRVNDTYGHLAGDVVIRSVGQMMAAELGPLGAVARIGGEEFALLSAGAPIEALATQLTDFCERLAATPVLVDGQSLRVTVSAGVAVREPGMPFDDLYADADRALYEAKLAGRNRVHFAPALEALVRRRSNGAVAPRNPLSRSA